MQAQFKLCTSIIHQKALSSFCGAIFFVVFLQTCCFSMENDIIDSLTDLGYVGAVFYTYVRIKYYMTIPDISSNVGHL